MYSDRVVELEGQLSAAQETIAAKIRYAKQQLQHTHIIYPIPIVPYVVYKSFELKIYIYIS